MLVRELIARLETMPKDVQVLLVKDDGDTLVPVSDVRVFGSFEATGETDHEFVTIER